MKDVNRPEGEEGTLISFDILETEVWLWVIPFSNGNTSLGVVGPTSFISPAIHFVFPLLIVIVTKKIR